MGGGGNGEAEAGAAEEGSEDGGGEGGGEAEPDQARGVEPDAVLPLVERQEDWEYLRIGLISYWEPNGFQEEYLVDKLAAIYWREARSLRFESESILVNLRHVPRDWWQSQRTQGEGGEDASPPTLTAEAVEEMDRMLALRLLPGEESLGKVMRYETMLHRRGMDIVQQLILLKGLREPGGGWRLRGPGVGAKGESKKSRSYVSGKYVRKEGASGGGREAEEEAQEVS